MKSLLLFAAIALSGAMFVGYYEKMEDADPEKVFFIKKHPTLQIKFVNIFANEADDKKLTRLSDVERQYVIDYCNYRLGISTELKTQQDLEHCKQR
ncbi:hypothetical protein [Pseudomonas sp. SM4]|jgi:hypothetical protein|uniref:hypothetical protein n=1 Tax=Pseudomonas sp. SM4 TaxID=3424177 RepID=UPI003F79CBB3